MLGSGMRTCSENQDWTGGEPQCIGKKSALMFTVKLKCDQAQAFDLASQKIIILMKWKTKLN